MSLTRSLIDRVNTILSSFNIKLDSLTAEKAKQHYLAQLKREKYFDKPAFPVPTAFHSDRYIQILQALPSYQTKLERFVSPTQNEVGYQFNNEYFRSPDAEVLYTIIREYQPATVIEIGCGNSTKITRQAIIDGNLSTKLISIDPYPRTDISTLPDELHRVKVESMAGKEVFAQLKANDVLFIDSSHDLKAGNDVLFLFLQVIPMLQKGVIIHIHDIFLPYDYPEDWLTEWNLEWNEAYLLQAILQFSTEFEVLWPGYYLQRSLSDFSRHFKHLVKGQNAQSFWIQKK